MKQFFEGYPDTNCAAAAAQLPWGHNMLLLNKIKEKDKRLWYIEQAKKGGWSRSTLDSWIESDLYERKGKALTNFKDTLPAIQSDLAEQLLKDPYNLDSVVKSIQPSYFSCLGSIFVLK